MLRISSRALNESDEPEFVDDSRLFAMMDYIVVLSISVPVVHSSFVAFRNEWIIAELSMDPKPASSACSSNALWSEVKGND